MYFIQFQKSKNSRQILQISNHKNPEPVVKTPISIILHKCKFKFVHFMDFFLNIYQFPKSYNYNFTTYRYENQI